MGGGNSEGRDALAPLINVRRVVVVVVVVVRRGAEGDKPTPHVTKCGVGSGAGMLLMCCMLEIAI